MRLVVLGHLFECVGEAVVGELFSDLEQACVGKVEQRIGEVGGFQLAEGRNELFRRRLLRRIELLGDLIPAGERCRALRERRSARAGTAQEQLSDVPGAQPVALDGGILDDRFP